MSYNISLLWTKQQYRLMRMSLSNFLSIFYYINCDLFKLTFHYSASSDTHTIEHISLVNYFLFASFTPIWLCMVKLLDSGIVYWKVSELYKIYINVWCSIFSGLSFVRIYIFCVIFLFWYQFLHYLIIFIVYNPGWNVFC